MPSARSPVISMFAAMARDSPRVHMNLSMCSAWASRTRSGTSWDSGPPSTSPLANPNIRSAAGLNSRMLCDASTATMASMTESIVWW